MTQLIAIKSINIWSKKQNDTKLNVATMYYVLVDIFNTVVVPSTKLVLNKPEDRQKQGASVNSECWRWKSYSISAENQEDTSSRVIELLYL